MLPVALLMMEHRLIERMIAVLKTELDTMTSTKKPNLVLVDSIVDFIRTYADRTHHGKEEEILFRELGHKKLPAEYRQTMDELVMEHVVARKETLALAESKERYIKGDLGAAGEMARHMGMLAEFYPKHIEKEDKCFFIPVMDHFSEKERDAMCLEFHEFDRRMIHEKYDKVVRRFEIERKLPGAKTKLDWIQQL
jgi:hemerythrin-like domain-containing protein